MIDVNSARLWMMRVSLGALGNQSVYPRFVDATPLFSRARRLGGWLARGNLNSPWLEETLIVERTRSSSKMKYSRLFAERRLRWCNATEPMDITSLRLRPPQTTWLSFWESMCHSMDISPPGLRSATVSLMGSPRRNLLRCREKLHKPRPIAKPMGSRSRMLISTPTRIPIFRCWKR